MPKKILLLIIAVVLLSSCNLISSSPSSVVKELIADAQKGDVDGMVALWSSKTSDEEGAAKIREKAKAFAAVAQKVKAAGEDMQIKNMHETIQGDRARVFFIYYDAKGTDSIGMGFALLKENGKWKLYRALDIGEEDGPFDKSFSAKSSPASTPNPEPNESPLEMVSPPPPPPARNSNQKTPSDSAASSAPSSNAAPISGGVLNSKAIALPKPAYPPVAKAAKASGMVAVIVTVDENGKVISANAASGHPLLRPAAESAARNARFNPAIVDGRRVKVTGTITYQFSPE